MSAGRRRHKGYSLRAKLVALLLVIVASACLVIALVTHISVAREMNRQTDERLQRSVSRIDKFNKPSASPTAAPKPAPGFLQAPGQGEYSLGALIKDGNVVAGGYIDKDGNTQQLSTADLATISTLTESSTPIDVTLTIGQYRLSVHDSENGTTSVTGISISDMTHTLLRLDITLAAVSLGVLAATGLLGYVLVKRTMEPLEEVALAARNVAGLSLASGEIEPITRVRGAIASRADEAGDMARALNTMLDNVDSSLNQRRASELTMRRFVADASHELRTPLTSVQGYADLIRISGTKDEGTGLAVDRILSNTSRMQTLVENLLLLARLDQQDEEGASRDTEHEFDLGEVLVESVMDAQVVAPDHEFELDIPEEPLDMWGESTLIERLIVNVVSNARKHTPAGTKVTVSARAGSDSHRIEIADNGPGMSEELVATVFDRFTRGDMSRTGKEGSSGLGMSIAKAVADRQGGSINIRSREGEGTTVIIDLPKRPQSRARKIASE